MDEGDVWANDASVLAAIGAHLAAQQLGVRVRLPGDLARTAIAAWERDDLGLETQESPDLVEVRHRAAALALIGLQASSQHVAAHGDDVVLVLDAWQVGQALDAAEAAGLLVGRTSSRD